MLLSPSFSRRALVSTLGAIASITLKIALIVTPIAASASDQTVEVVNNVIVVTASNTEDNQSFIPKHYTCSYQNLTRHIEVEYSGAGPVPCKVLYEKDTEQPHHIETLWQAENTVGYCEQKAENFAKKLNSWGWDCQELQEQETQDS